MPTVCLRCLDAEGEAPVDGGAADNPLLADVEEPLGIADGAVLLVGVEDPRGIGDGLALDFFALSSSSMKSSTTYIS